MAKIVALDVGAKRTGVAESDSMHMMAFPLETVETEYVMTFLQRRQEEEPIEELVVGAPVRWDGTPSEVAHFIDGLCQKMGEKWPKESGSNDGTTANAEYTRTARAPPCSSSRYTRGP